jgi:hypothetical protein
MIRARGITAMLFLSGLAIAVLVAPMDAYQPAKSTAMDAKDLLPNRKQMPLKSNAIGILLVDGQQFLSTEGRSGPLDQVCFSTAGCSYRWVYVTVVNGAQIQNLQVPVGDNGAFQVYPALDLARLKNLKTFGIEAGYTLVEIEVNNRQGSPKYDSFVATNVRILEGSKEFPLKTADVVKQMQRKFADYLKENAKAIDEAMEKAGKDGLKKDEKATGPREKSEVMYVTWLPDTETMRVHFKVRISDGSYKWVGGGAMPRDPLPMPPPPGGGPKGKVMLPPPPPKDFKVRVGTTFGVDFGVAYEIDKTGKLLNTEVVPFQTFVTQLPMPAGIAPGLPPAKQN